MSRKIENVILITEKANSLATIKAVSSFDLNQDGKNALHFSTTEQFLSIIQMTNGIDEYDDEELAEIKLKIKKPVFFLLDTNSFDLLKKFVTTLPNNFYFLIDNNSGSIMERQELMRCEAPDTLFSSLATKSS